MRVTCLDLRVEYVEKILTDCATVGYGIKRLLLMGIFSTRQTTKGPEGPFLVFSTLVPRSRSKYDQIGVTNGLEYAIID